MPATVKRLPALAPAQVSYHRVRKTVHAICFLAFAAAPFANIIRFDIPQQRFYFAGRELWINEFAIIFFTLMFLMFVVVASSIFYGRVYCGYLCPQMIFSETSISLQARLRKWFNRRMSHWPERRRRLAAGLTFYSALALASVLLAFIFISYFVEPRDLLHRLAALDVHTAGGIAGAAVTALTFLDFTLVRERFCTTVCPYGYLQGLLGDRNTLLVTYADPAGNCIECKKCVRVCHMGIDIRKSPHQIECVHCGECVDACEDVLRRIGREGLIHYSWGETSTRAREPWYRRLGFRDAKRALVLLVLLFYASGLFVALSMRRAVLVRVAPIRATLYRVGRDGTVFNRFRFSLANRGRTAAAVVFSLEQLPGARLVMETNPVRIEPGRTSEGEFEIAAPQSSSAALVNHFRILGTTIPGQAVDAIPMTFLMPAGGRARSNTP